MWDSEKGGKRKKKDRTGTKTKGGGWIEGKKMTDNEQRETKWTERQNEEKQGRWMGEGGPGG